MSDIPNLNSGALSFVLALVEGLGLGKVGVGILHELRLGLGVAEAIGLSFDRRIDGAIRLHVLMIGKAPAAHIVELASSRESSCGKAERKCAGNCRRHIPVHGCISLWGFRPFSGQQKNAWAWLPVPASPRLPSGKAWRSSRSARAPWRRNWLPPR